jgi:LPS-assembly lipoprotein
LKTTALKITAMTKLIANLSKTLVLISAVFVSACGFHLRGSDNESVSSQPVYVTSSKGNTRVFLKLKQSLQLAGADVVASPASAQNRLTLLAENSERRTASLDNQARTAEYVLFLSIDFQVSDAEGKPLSDPQRVSGSRVYVHDVNRIVAANDEAQLVLFELQDKLVNQILRRYQTIVAAPPSGATTTGQGTEDQSSSEK